MTPVDRKLSRAVLGFDLEAELQTAREELRAGPSRMARTLVKEGPLRVTLVGLGPGGTIRPHQADAPITIHVLEGEILLETGSEIHRRSKGSLVALDRGVRHAVSAPNGGFFLLTLTGQSKSEAGP
jgi:quercetin dioxygenase-like cupin family protein